ncbi:conserved hypothetical protein [Prevotella intermedia]|uniref:Uncharacterized protein n=1 Tax=Prevotella intermedia TaxID=28131 RepID=A0A0T7AP62_PREIN|nr:conserved hypothetical protein [Prevotella intermedia]
MLPARLFPLLPSSVPLDFQLRAQPHTQRISI